MGTAPTSVFEATPQSFVLQSAHFRQTSFPPSDVEEEAQSLFSRLVKEHAETEGVTEQLKSAYQIAWVRRMNNICERTTETLNTYLIYT